MGKNKSTQRPRLLIIIFIIGIFVYITINTQYNWFSELIFDQEKIEIKSERFDLDLFLLDSSNYEKKLLEWEEENKGFLNYYLQNHIGMYYDRDSMKKSHVLSFVSHPDALLYQKSIQENFVDLDVYTEKIKEAFVEYLSIFPDSTIPKKIIYSNSFNSYGVDVYNQNLIVGLDFYLGEFHPDSNIWEYLKLRYHEKYMIADIMEYWITSSFIHENSMERFQNELIFKGKIIYLMDLILEEDKHVLFRFSEKDLEWCNIHESNIWNEIISLDLMYSKDYNSYATFFSDAPFTKGMPKESPARLGYWVGYKIIDSYMSNNNVSTQELMSNTNYQDILLKSKYRP